MKNFKELYESHADGLASLYDALYKENLFEESSYPLLLSTWEDEPMPKVMFFGQETNGWGDGEDIDTLMKGYREFDLGKNYPSLFWKYLWMLSEKLELRGKHPFLWNNINKLGKQASTGHAEQRATALENEHFNVLREELELVKPEVCVFFSGPYYDEDLAAKLPDLEIIPMDGYKENEFVRFSSRYLPKNSFRTYHPGYGNRYYSWFQEVLDTIVDECRNSVL